MELIYAEFPILSLILVCCTLALLIVLLLPESNQFAIKLVSVICSGITLILTLYLFIVFDRTQVGMQFVEKVDWIPALNISYFNGVDGFSVPLLLLTGIVFFTGVLTMWELETRVREFFALFIFLVIGVFGMFMSLDLFFLFVWYDVSLLPMYLLIVIWGTTDKEYNAMKLMLYLLLGSALILPGIVYIVFKSDVHTFSLPELVANGNFATQDQIIVFFLFYIGFGILAGIWPFHTWSPPGHVAAPTAVSMLHAGVLMKIGGFGILRLGIFLCPEGWDFWAPLMAVLATVGIVYGSLAALRQTDLKFVIGYSSVSHMGIVGLGLSTQTVDGLNGAVFQMFAHGVMTALFFSAVGYIYDRTHTKSIDQLGGLVHIMPKASSFFIIAALAGIGVPGLASFWAELMVFIAAFRVYPLAAVLSISALVFSAIFMLRVVEKTFFGPLNKKYLALKDMTFGLSIPRMILVATIIIFGLMPFLMFDTIQSTSVWLIEGNF
jgi:NADH-quinone oxidoreductase subunit M